MIEIEMSKDIREYEPRVMGSLTKRQILFVTLGCIISFPITLILPIPILYIKLILFVVGVFPIAICGWVDVQGMHLEKYVWYIIQNHVLNPTRRKYKTDNLLYKEITKEEKTEETPKTKKKQKKKRKVYPKKYRPYD